jgi:retron-type reverse transcriptase
LISAAPYCDRVVHHAICNVIEPVFEPSFIFDSYANRTGKGTHRAILRYQEFARKNTYVLKADIKKYFPSIDHEILKSAIRKKIGCPKTLKLIDQIIDNSNPQEPVFDYFPGDDLFSLTRKKGIPIGNLTSQFFANIYLNAFDHYVKEQMGCKFYIRYVDDFVIFGKNKQELWTILDKCKEYLSANRLVLHPNKSRIFQVSEGIEFLGHRVFPHLRLLKKQNIRRFKRKFRKQIRMYDRGVLSEIEWIRSFNSWQGHAAFSKTWRLRNKVVMYLEKKGVSTKLVSSGADRGTTTTGTAVLPTATGTTLTTGTTTTGSGWPSTIQCPNRPF